MISFEDSWGYALAKPCQCVRLEIERGCPARLQLRRYDKVRETAATYLSFRTLNHGLATVNKSISWYMDVLSPLSGITTAERICAGSLAEKL